MTHSQYLIVKVCIPQCGGYKDTAYQHTYIHILNVNLVLETIMTLHRELGMMKVENAFPMKSVIIKVSS